MGNAIRPTPETEAEALRIVLAVDPEAPAALADSVELISTDLTDAIRQQRERGPIRSPVPVSDLERVVTDLLPRVLRHRHYRRLLALATGGAWNPSPVAADLAKAVESWCGHPAASAWGELRSQVRDTLASYLRSVEGYLGSLLGTDKIVR